jgi:hypothetical protein
LPLFWTCVALCLPEPDGEANNLRWDRVPTSPIPTHEKRPRESSRGHPIPHDDHWFTGRPRTRTTGGHTELAGLPVAVSAFELGKP